MASDTLLGAVYTRFSAQDLLAAAVPGSPYLDEVPEGVALPYVLITDHDEIPDWSSEDATIEQGKWQFKVYGVGTAAVEAIATLIKTAFDWQTLDITGGSIAIERQRYQVKLDRERSTAQQRVTCATLSYQALTRRLLSS